MTWPAPTCCTARSAQERGSRRGRRAAAGRRPAAGPSLNVTDNGVRRPLDIAGLARHHRSRRRGPDRVHRHRSDPEGNRQNLYDGIPVDEVFKSAILSARALVEKDPAYSQVTARLLLHTIRKEVLGQEVSQADMSQRYADYFPTFISRGIEGGLLSPDLSQYDLAAGPGAGRQPRPAVRLPRPANSVRPLLRTSAAPASNCRRSSCAWPWAWR